MYQRNIHFIDVNNLLLVSKKRKKKLIQNGGTKEIKTTYTYM